MSLKTLHGSTAQPSCSRFEAVFSERTEDCTPIKDSSKPSLVSLVELFLVYHRAASMRCQVQVIVCAMIWTMFFYFQENHQQHLSSCLLSVFSPDEMRPLSYPSCSLVC